jgi:hypothetical protein
MAENTSSDRRVQTVKQRLEEDLVDQQGHPVKPDDVSTLVDAKAETFADAPVQEFVPLLIEHEARDELRQKGLHRDLGDDTRTTSEPVGSQPMDEAPPAGDRRAERDPAADQAANHIRGSGEAT